MGEGGTGKHGVLREEQACFRFRHARRLAGQCKMHLHWGASDIKPIPNPHSLDNLQTVDPTVSPPPHSPPLMCIVSAVRRICSCNCRVDFGVVPAVAVAGSAGPGARVCFMCGNCPAPHRHATVSVVCLACGSIKAIFNVHKISQKDILVISTMHPPKSGADLTR